jgi:hypothetical protein
MFFAIALFITLIPTALFSATLYNDDHDFWYGPLLVPITLSFCIVLELL